MLLAFAALTRVIALGVHGEILQLGHLMRQFDLLLIVRLDLFLGRRQVVVGQIVHQGPRLHEHLDLTVDADLETAKLLLVLGLAEVANQLLCRCLEVLADHSRIFGHRIVIFLASLNRVDGLGSKGIVTLLEQGMSPK